MYGMHTNKQNLTARIHPNRSDEEEQQETFGGC